MLEVSGLSCLTLAEAAGYKQALVERRFARARERVAGLQAALDGARAELEEASAALSELARLCEALSSPLRPGGPLRDHKFS